MFDTLDTDGNGYLTFEEFSSGFSTFALHWLFRFESIQQSFKKHTHFFLDLYYMYILGCLYNLLANVFVYSGEFMFGPGVAPVEPSAGEEPVSRMSPEVLYENQWEERISRAEDDEEKHFCMLMENLGASNIFEE